MRALRGLFINLLILIILLTLKPKTFFWEKKFNDIKKLKINLIFFYEDLSDENNNFGLYNRLKLEVSGGFFGVQNYSAFFNLLCEIENKDSSLDNSFILISTGSSFKKIEKLCNRSKKIKSIFIYCRYTNNYKYLEKFNSKVDLVSNNIYNIWKLW